MGENEEQKLDPSNKKERRTLIQVLLINFSQVALAGIVGFIISSSGLLGTALDSAGDMAVYLVSLYAVGKSVRAKVGAATFSGIFLELISKMVLNRYRLCGLGVEISVMKGGVWLSDAEWAVVSDLLPKQRRRKDGKGRPRRNPREVLNGIIYILFSGAPWHLLPQEYPPYQTCHRYFQVWTKAGVFRKMLARLSAYHGGKRKGKPTAYIDGSFATAKKGVRA